jgi:hypothetical protein
MEKVTIQELRNDYMSHRPTRKRPTKNGLAVANAVISPYGDRLVNIDKLQGE